MLTQNIQLNVKYAVKSHVQSYVYLKAFKYASYLSYNPKMRSKHIIHKQSPLLERQ